MSFMFDGPSRRPDPYIEPAPRPFTEPGERYRAASARADLDADRGSLFRPGKGQVEEERVERLRAIADRLGIPEEFEATGPYATPSPGMGFDTMTPDERRAMQFGGMDGDAIARLRRNQYLLSIEQDPAALLARAAAAAEADPYGWTDVPTDLAKLDDEVRKTLRARYADHSEILMMAPEDASAVETLGEMQSDFLTPENAAAMAASALVPGGAVARIAAEGALGGAIEGLEFGDRARMAEYLGTATPDLATRVGTGILFGAGVQGVFEGAAIGARAILSPEARADSSARIRNTLPNRFRSRNTANLVEAEGAVRQAEDAIRSGDPSRLPAPPAAAPVRGIPDMDAAVAAVIRQESGGDASAVSPAGAIGLMQVMPATARDPGFGVPGVFTLARELGKDVADETNETLGILLRDADVSRAFGTRYLSAMIDRYDDFDTALVAYNAGPGVADAWVANGRQRLSLPAETRTYVKRVNGFLDRPDQKAAVDTGETDILVTPAGTEHPFRYEIVELDSVIHSHVDGQVNPAFPLARQPRDRSSLASEATIDGYARNLQPRKLGRSAFVGDGAPVVALDDVVDAGNGRTEAVRRAYERFPDQADAYVEYLKAQGFEVDGFTRPILIRRRLDDLGKEGTAAFASGSNTPTVAAPTVVERARADAGALSDSAIENYGGGDFNATRNGGFVRAVIAAIPPTERDLLTSADGTALNIDGIARAERMLMATAYDDARLLDIAFDRPDEVSRSVVGALQDAAPDAIRLRKAVAAGDLPGDLDVVNDILGAVLRVRQARKDGITVADSLDQSDFLARSTDGADTAITRMLFADDDMTRLASREKMGSRIGTLLSRIRQEAGGSLFGDDLRMAAGEIARDVLKAEGVTVPIARKAPPAAPKAAPEAIPKATPKAAPTSTAPEAAALQERDGADMFSPAEAVEEPAPAMARTDPPEARPIARPTDAPRPAPPPARATRSTGEDAAQIARTMQAERTIRERIAADPAIAAMPDPETGGTVADMLADLEADADLGAALHACTIGGRP